MPLLAGMMRQVGSFLPHRLKCCLKMALGVPNMESSLLNMKRNGFNPAVVIDVGAYSGGWTCMCKLIFPAARVLMIEPQTCKKSDLERVMAEYTDIALASVLVGPAEKAAVGFYETESASSVLPEVEKNNMPTVCLPMTTLDAVTKNTHFAHPDFIKLDVQGYELQVLEGGAAVLASAEAVLMEVNLLEIYQGAPLFNTAVRFMEDRGFQVYDVCTFFRRPYDRALWQMDVIFVRSSSALVSSKRWC